MVNAGVRITLVFLVARSEGSFGSKIDQKTRPENQNQVAGTATSFLARETVGFCLNAHAGPYGGRKSIVVQLVLYGQARSLSDMMPCLVMFCLRQTLLT